jgi:hypothetical protein
MTVDFYMEGGFQLKSLLITPDWTIIIRDIDNMQTQRSWDLLFLLFQTHKEPQPYAPQYQL